MKKILAIDDSVENLEILENYITIAFPEMEFIGALAGKEGINLCLLNRPQVVLLDILMPGIDGYKVCQALKSHPLLKNIPVIMITASQDNKEYKIKALELGADAFLSKPIDQSELIAQLKAMLRIKAADEQKQDDNLRLEEMVRNRTEALEKELEQRKLAEKYYHTLIDKATDGIVLIDKDGKFKYISATARRIFGYFADISEFPDPGLLTHPDDLPSVISALENIITHPKIISTLEYRFKHNDGSWIWVESTLSNQFDEPGIEAIVINFRDVSERKKSEERIFESEERYRTLVETSPDGICMTDMTGKIIIVNKEFCHIFGYEDESDLKKSCNYFPDTLSPISKSEIAQALTQNATNQVFSHEYVAVNKKGKEFPIEIRQAAIAGEANEKYANILIIKDISRDQKISDTHKFLMSSGWKKDSEEFFLSLCKFLSTTLDMEFILIDRLGPGENEATTIVNFAKGEIIPNMIYQLEDTPCEQVIGLSVLCYDRDITVHFPNDKLLKQIKAVGYAGITLWNSSGKAIGLIAMVSLKPIDDTSLIEAVLNLVSIRASGELERRATELELMKSRMAFQNYFHNCSIGMSVTSPDKKWLEVNQALCDMMGYSKEELTRLTWVDITHPDDIQKNMDFYLKVKDGEINQYELDKRFIRKNGSILYATISVVCERESDGSIHHFLASYIDITSHHLAQEEVRKERFLLRTLIDNLPNPVYVKDVNGRKIVANKADVEFNKFASEAELVGRTDPEIFGVSGNQGYNEDMMVIHTGSEILNKESIFTDSTGKSSWRLNSKIPLYDQNSKIQGLVGIGYDITERKEFDIALKNSEELYRNLVERMPDGVYKTTSDGKFISANPALVKLLGYDSKEELLATNIKRDLYVDAFDRETITLQNDRNGIEIYNLRKKDGSVIWVEDHAWYLKDENGNITYHEGILRDVTERMKVEDKLRSLSRAVDQNPASIMITNTKGEIEYVNQNFIESTGYSAEEVMGKEPGFLKTNYTSKTDFDLMWSTILSGGEWHGEFKNKKKNGEFFYEEATISPIKDDNGQITHFLAVKLDITAKKNDEKLISKLSKAIEQSPVAIVITDESGKIEFVNTSFTELTQYSIKEIINKPPRIFNPKHLSENDFIMMWENLKSGKVWKGEFLNRRKDKTCYWEDVIISPLLDLKGNITNYILVMDDISEKKAMIDQLITSKDKAEESNRLKSAFLATMNHELRTPLHHIIGFSELIISQVLPEDNIDFANSIHTSGNNLLTIIEDIFDLALFEQSDIKIKNQTFSIIEQFMENKASLDSILMDSAKQDNIQLVFKPDTNWLPSYITADRSKINQVLNHLFKNAVKYTNTGSVEFGYTIDNKSSITYYIKDTGIGIKKDQQQIIFEFFRQAEEYNTRNYGGIGIGLSISRKIAKVLNGELKVISEPDIGSTFFLTIPIELSDFSS